MKKKLLTLAIGLFLSISLFAAPPPNGTTVETTAYAASLVVAASPARLVAVWGYNSGGAQFLQIHDSTTLPANAAVPKVAFAIAATSNFYFDVPLTGIDFGTGIVVCNSSTEQTKTIGSANCWINAIYLTN